jgi:hypothetical protein
MTEPAIATAPPVVPEQDGPALARAHTVDTNGMPSPRIAIHEDATAEERHSIVSHM